ncbi:MAG: recombination mediator RecR [Bacilli bacterium]|nr:recombination mediator RecR [Bacilli bacterium]
MNYPASFQKLIDSFKLLPGVGEKTAERYAFTLLGLEENKICDFSEAIGNIKKDITTCPNCGCLSDSNKCLICEDETRNRNIICVVESQKNVFVFEKIGAFKTKYHVLGGLISPIEGVNPEDLSINSLIERIKKENIKEIILALRPGIEGNTTSLYIRKLLETMKVKVTQIAQGVPIGADMEYLDNLTLEMAIENRSEVS